MTESLERYAAARDDVADALDALRALLAPAASWYDAAADLDALSALAERLRTGRFVLAVVGEFSSGKSFLLNALLGKIALEERAGTTRIVGLLATDINPSTATITELSYATEEAAVAHFEDGREERVPIDLLARFETGGEAAVLRVGVDSPFLRNGFVVADTPGLASIDPAHRRATLRYLPEADAVLYLIDTQQPFADGDAAFLGIVRRSIESIFIVQTKIDLWRAHAGAGEREIWEAAAARIVAQTALHAPGTPVFPLSARDYAEGGLTGDAALVERSRFLPFLAALDDSLVATTGRSRLQRAAAEARRVAQRAAETCALDAAALERDPATVAGERAALEPRLAALDALAADGRGRLERTGTELRAAVAAAGVALRAELDRTIGRAFDITDIARLRDRPRLHGIVDATVAAAMERFAGDVAVLVTHALSDTAQSICANLATDPLPLAADAARAFDADPASGAWSIDLATGIRSTIVISALGGPAVSFVAAIAGRFAAAPFGTYMKRELIADMDTDLAPAFEREIEGFVDGVGKRLERIAGLLAERVGALAVRARTDALGALDRAAAVAAGSDRAAAAAALRARGAAAGAAAEQIATRAAAFAAELATAPPRAVTAVAAEPAHATADENRFDPETYEHGLHPERWRVAVVGAWKRGKSSLINALAERPVLADADDAAFRFPVHVRYGPEPHAYALTDDAVWDEIPPDAVLAAAARTPVLVLVPWSLPHELVLVHAPAFDAGVPAAEEIVFAAAGAASEILALFSRQLSDVELDLYGRLGRLGKPITFVHTIADHETPSERRRVVNLAEEYLRERAIATPRIFTVSTRERGGWNELGALRGTLAAHAEEHMERLRRVQRDRAEQARLASSVAQGPPRKPTLLERILGDRR